MGGALRIPAESYEQLDETLWDVEVYIHRAMEKLKEYNAILKSLRVAGASKKHGQGRSR